MTAKGTHLIGASALGTAVALIVAACGGDDGETTDDGAASDADVNVVAESTSAFAEDAYTADAGDLSVLYANDDSITHTLLVDGGPEDFKLTVTTNGDTDTGDVQLEPGEYRLWCDQSGHTMEATLTVE